MIRRIWDWLTKPAPPTCAHEWETTDIGTLKSKEDKPIGCSFTLRCKKCGDITFRNNSIADFYK